MELTQDEARALMSRLLGGQDMRMYPFDAGWLAKPVLTPEQTAAGQGLGLGSFIVDRTGVVTAHSSLPVTMIMEEYVAARRQGRIRGRQVWPPALTDEEARTLATRLSEGRDATLEPFAFGWVTTTPADGEHLIVDRTGVVTGHSGRSATDTAEAYAARRRSGEIPGRRVWPPMGATPVEFGWVTSRGSTTLVLGRTGEVTEYPGRSIAEVIREHPTGR